MDSKDAGFAVSIWPDPPAGHILEAADRTAIQTQHLIVRLRVRLANHIGVLKALFPMETQLESLSASDVRHIASLARLELSDEEVENMRSQLADILERFEALAEVSTDGVEQTGHWADMYSVMRADRPDRSFVRSEVVANAPDHDGEFLRVKPVLE